MPLHKSLKETLFCVGLLCLCSTSSGAIPLIIGPATVAGTNGPPNGTNTPTYTVVGTIAASELFSFTASGSVDVAPGVGNGAGFTTNAAGVELFGFEAPGSVIPGVNSPYLGSDVGSLDIRSDGGNTFHQIFAAATNGQNSANAPILLTYNGTVGSIFGGSLTNGEVLSFGISDGGDQLDNTGSFQISGQIGGSVPEIDGGSAVVPIAFCLGLFLLVSGRKRHLSAD